MSDTPIEPTPKVTLTVTTVNKDESYTSVPLDPEIANQAYMALALGQGVIELQIPRRSRPVTIAAHYAVTWFLTDLVPDDAPTEGQDEGRPNPHPGKGPKKK